MSQRKKRKIYRLAAKAGVVRREFGLPALQTTHADIARAIIANSGGKKTVSKRNAGSIIDSYYQDLTDSGEIKNKIKRKRKKFTIINELIDHADTIGLPKRCHPLKGTKIYKGFYQSSEWRQLRYLALRNSEGCCCCCGARASDGIVLHVDHIKPRSRYPELELSLDNLQILCEDCNKGKVDMDNYDWRDHWQTI